jgi:hypothetical protein
MNSAITFFFIFLTAFTFTFGMILGDTLGEVGMKREAVKLGHAFYTNDVSGASV